MAISRIGLDTYTAQTIPDHSPMNVGPILINPNWFHQVHVWANLRGIHLRVGPADMFLMEKPPSDTTPWPDVRYGRRVEFANASDELRHGEDLHAWMHERLPHMRVRLAERMYLTDALLERLTPDMKRKFEHFWNTYACTWAVPV